MRNCGSLGSTLQEWRPWHGSYVTCTAQPTSAVLDARAFLIPPPASPKRAGVLRNCSRATGRCGPTGRRCTETSEFCPMRAIVVLRVTYPRTFPRLVVGLLRFRQTLNIRDVENCRIRWMHHRLEYPLSCTIKLRRSPEHNYRNPM